MKNKKQYNSCFGFKPLKKRLSQSQQAKRLEKIAKRLTK